MASALLGTDQAVAWVLLVGVLTLLAHAVLRIPASAVSISSDPGNRERQAMTRIVFLIVYFEAFVLYADIYGGIEPARDLPYTLLLVVGGILALYYFGTVVIYVLYLTMTRRNFEADAVRLVRDTCASVLLTLFTSALFYQRFGVNAPEGTIPGPGDYLYFSAVTFSTLGYGDFSPAQLSRPVAAIEAILGNLHLGIVVGTVLVALTVRPKEATEPEDPA